MKGQILSIEINNFTKIQIKPIKCNQVVAFKSNSIPQDTVELSTKKNELSNGAKVGIGVGIISALALGVELIKFRGKHIEKFWKKIKGDCNKAEVKNPPETPKESKNIKGKEEPKTPTPNVLPPVADFKNIEEAKSYFESIGVKTVFKSGSERHLADLNQAKNDLVILEKNGVAKPKPDSIIIADWHNKDELKQIFRAHNIAEKEADIYNSSTWAWGAATSGLDNKCHVLINSSFAGNYGRFIHEMGHVHQDFLNSSYWHSVGLNNKEFMQKQLDVFGHPEILLSPEFNIPDKHISSVLRYHNISKNASEGFKADIYRMFPEIREEDLEKVFLIPGKNGKNYVINAKKMVDKMASESGVYAPTKTWENVAEIFQGLNQGKEYSDLVMLMYDINGGGRVPNLVVKGMKYDDYIASLYNNKDLIRQLRECVKIKEY